MKFTWMVLMTAVFTIGHGPADAAPAAPIDPKSSGKTPVALVDDLERPDLKATTERLPVRVNIHRAVANSPAVFAAFVELTQTLRFQTEVDAGLRELAILHVLKSHGGDYEFAKHRTGSIAAGLLSEEEVARVDDPEAPLYSARQRAVLRFARRFAADPAQRSGLPADDVHAFLNDRERVELGVTLAWYLGLAHFTASLDIPDDGDDLLKTPGLIVDLGQKQPR